MPEIIHRIKNSSSLLATKLANYWEDDRISYIKQTILTNGLGIDNFTDEDVNYLNQSLPTIDYTYYLANLTSWRAKLGVIIIITL